MDAKIRKRQLTRAIRKILAAAKEYADIEAQLIAEGDKENIQPETRPRPAAAREGLCEGATS